MNRITQLLFSLLIIVGLGSQASAQSGIYVQGAIQEAGAVSIGGAVDSVGGLVDYATYAALPTGSTEAFATLNSLGVWRDPAGPGTDKPWVPMEMQDWTYVDGINADTYVPGPTFGDWAESNGGGGTVTVHDGIIDLDSGGTGTGDLAFIYYDMAGGWPAGHDIRVIARLSAPTPGDLAYGYLKIEDNTAGADAQLKFWPDAGSSNGVGNESGVRQGAGGFPDPGTGTNTWVIDHRGATANDMSSAWDLENAATLAACYGSNVATATTVDRVSIAAGGNGAGSAAAWSVISISVYTRAQP